MKHTKYWLISLFAILLVSSCTDKNNNRDSDVQGDTDKVDSLTFEEPISDSIIDKETEPVPKAETLTIDKPKSKPANTISSNDKSYYYWSDEYFIWKKSDNYFKDSSQYIGNELSKNPDLTKNKISQLWRNYMVKKYQIHHRGDESIR